MHSSLGREAPRRLNRMLLQPSCRSFGMDDDTAYLTYLLTWPALGLEGYKTPASHEANIERIPAEMSNFVMFIS